MPPKRQAMWNELKAKMAAKRARAETGKRGKNATAHHELIVQRLAAEPDNKQTFKPVSPREFVAFDHDELNLTNLKRACAKHFNLPAASCDVLVSNKGPSCTNIAQIAHRKDKVGICATIKFWAIHFNIHTTRFSEGVKHFHFLGGVYLLVKFP